MYICGLNKTTLLDYPGHLAATVFLGGCNFRCPYCQNKDLLLHPGDFAAYEKEDIFQHLKKRKGILEGVCITGGEPTLNADLPDLIRQIKAMGYLVKLDTNGTNPRMMMDLYEEGLLDYVAMDIKSGPGGYARVAGIGPAASDPGTASRTTFQSDKKERLLDAVKESVAFLLHTPHREGFDFEFRTTLVRELHSEEDLREIAEWIAGAPHYFLQSYEESDGVLQKGLSAYTKEELERLLAIAKEGVPSASLRGVE